MTYSDLAEIRKLTRNVEAILLGVIIPLCQRNSGRLEEADREVKRYFLMLNFHFAGRQHNILRCVMFVNAKVK